MQITEYNFALILNMPKKEKEIKGVSSSIVKTR